MIQHLVLTALLAALALSACVQKRVDGSFDCTANRGDTKGAKRDDKPLIVVVPKGTTGDFWQLVRAGASKAALKDGAYLEWPSTFRENELAGQARVVKESVSLALHQHREFALVVDPLYGAAFYGLVRDWMTDFDLPVVAFDEEVVGNRDRSDGRTRFVKFVGIDNYAAGRRMGEYVAKKLGGAGNVAMLRLNPGVGTTSLREQGFIDAIKDRGLTPKWPSYYWAINLDVDSAYREGRMLLKDVDDYAAKHPGFRLDAVFTPNESTTIGMLRALQDRRLAGPGFTFVGFDRSPLLQNALERQQITALMVQDPYEMGKASVEAAVKLLCLKREDKDGFEERVKTRAFMPDYLEPVLVDSEALKSCRAAYEANGPDDPLSGVIEALVRRSYALKRFLGRRDSDSSDSVAAKCDSKVLWLLYSQPRTYHLQSPGSST